ncbi:unknown [Haloarcula marismortui ATCC 43049]|uniref:CGCGG family rSAM-modified RiPP protein n=1 Tax=Haloarcula marismortui (strain ATCC 43049 / DSM 3752 / JCM 8966 / VKM B-1809) TaxID=272569 RepID=Q5UX42_HALMA|nr:CGCGG family rSAM-modified RiPP protein [Haloarcula marismortui]AAV48161.1 unknown [Haloarcula marismortui ATCC 43049]QCP92826.1 CGCGG family rSAM-modified RiPP protein [Haloarcula marismortui ATCC 43049]
MSHSHEDVPPVTTEVHDTSWSANLETPAHAKDPNVVVEQAIDAVEMTTAGNHVNLVSHADHGHPETYLFDALAEAFGETISVEYVQQCGCGGHVTRVHREA